MNVQVKLFLSLLLSMMVNKLHGFPVPPFSQPSPSISEHQTYPEFPPGHLPGQWQWLNATSTLPDDVDRMPDNRVLCLTFESDHHLWIPGTVNEPETAGNETLKCTYFFEKQKQMTESFWVLIKLKGQTITLGYWVLFRNSFPTLNPESELCIHKSESGAFIPGLTRRDESGEYCESNQDYTDYLTAYYFERSISPVLFMLSAEAAVILLIITRMFYFYKTSKRD